MRPCSTRHFPLLVIATALLATPLLSQNSVNERDAGTSLKDYKKDKRSSDEPERKELSDQERKDRLRSFKREVSKTYQTWLDQDVRYIISREEEQAFKLLSNDEERDSFIEQFWLRRSPTPDTELNEFREEHYRRIQYANEHFAAGIPGWKTDRGHIYIVWGAPDEIESHPSGGSYQRDSSEGGGNTSTFPFERWRYRYLENIGNDITVEFVDSCMCGDYHIALNPNEKDALLHTPGGGPTLSEQMGRGNRTNRMMGIDPGGSVKQFDALERYAKLTATPPIKFKDLEEKVNTRIRYNLVPFDLRTDFVKLTSDTVLVPVTIQIKTRDMSFIQKQGVHQASANIFGRISTLSGRVATTFEDTVTVNEASDLFEKALLTSHLYWKAVSLRPGMYKIEVAIKDVNGDRVGTLARSLRVPEFEDEKLASSSLILADVMERLPAKSIGAGSFVIGDVKVRPRLDSANGKSASFKRSQRLNIWLQIYNLRQEQKTRNTQARISYEIINIQTNKPVFHTAESSDAYGKNSEQITLAKSMSLANMEPGLYSLKITVNDEVSKQTISPSARFQVE